MIQKIHLSLSTASTAFVNLDLYEGDKVYIYIKRTLYKGYDVQEFDSIELSSENVDETFNEYGACLLPSYYISSSYITKFEVTSIDDGYKQRGNNLAIKNKSDTNSYELDIEYNYEDFIPSFLLTVNNTNSTLVYKENDKLKYLAKTYRLPYSGNAIAVKSKNEIFYYALMSSGANLSSLSVNIKNKKYHLQLIPNSVICINNNLEELYAFNNGQLEKITLNSINKISYKNKTINKVLYIKELGIFVINIHCESDNKSASSWWSNFFGSSIKYSDKESVVAISYDGINYSFPQATISNDIFEILYDTRLKKFIYYVYLEDPSRPAIVYRELATGLEVKFENGIVEFDTKQLYYYLVPMPNGRVIFDHHNHCIAIGHSALYGYDFKILFYGEDSREKATVFGGVDSFFYNETLKKYFVVKTIDKVKKYYYSLESNENLSDMTTWTEGSINDIFPSYGKIGNVEVLNATSVSYDGKVVYSKIPTLFKIDPPSMAYDPYTDSYLLICLDRGIYKTDSNFLKFTKVKEYLSISNVSITGFYNC